jgi:mannose-1-phosphate guanylyltransferase
VVQPRDRGTAAGVLLPLTAVLRRDPEAVVVLLPADHHVEKEWILQTALHQGVAIARAHPDRVVLLGISPEDEKDSEYGWIVPSRSYLPFGPAAVERFREKPDAAEAAALLAQGAMVSSFLVVARASTLRTLYEERLPSLAGLLFQRRAGESRLREIYGEIPSHDFSRDLLETSVDRLWVVPVAPCGWTDLGTPERVARCLKSCRIEPLPATVGTRRRFVPPVDLSRRLVSRDA